MDHHIRRCTRTSLSMALAVGLVASTVACSRDKSDLPPPASPPAVVPTPSGSLSPEDAAAAEDIFAAFDNYMEALIELSTEGVAGGTDETMARLEEVHIGGELYNNLAFDLLTANFMAGHINAGTINWNAELVSIDWNHSFEHRPDEVVPLAVLRVCFDESGWTTIDKESKRIVDGPGERFLSTVTITWRDEDPHRPEREPRWQAAFREDSDEAC